jgi:hypothetical protein
MKVHISRRVELIDIPLFRTYTALVLPLPLHLLMPNDLGGYSTRLNLGGPCLIVSRPLSAVAPAFELNRPKSNMPHKSVLLSLPSLRL